MFVFCENSLANKYTPEFEFYYAVLLLVCCCWGYCCETKEDAFGRAIQGLSARKMTQMMEEQTWPCSFFLYPMHTRTC